MSQTNRIKPATGIVGIAATFTIGWGLWHLLFAPNGVMKLYTPMYGFALLALYFGILIAMTDIFGMGSDQSSPVRGAGLAVLSLGMLAIVFYGFFWNFLGRFGVTYFSPQAIIDAGGTGAEFFNARENSSLAIIYLVAAFVWVASAWKLALGERPWQEFPCRSAALARFFGITLTAGIAYLIFFHPHVTSLFYPAQTFAGVPPWWEERAMTSSAYFNLGWIFATLFIFLLLEQAWELPAGVLRKGILAPILALAAAVLGGFLLFWGLEGVMNLFWDEPFIGGSYTDAPYFRHLHVAEVSGFLILGLLIWRVFLGNWPTAMPPVFRGLLRTGAAVLLGLGLWWFYYSEGIGTAFLDRVPGFAQPDDTPLAWTLLMLCLILVYERFFGAWPLRRTQA